MGRRKLAERKIPPHGLQWVAHGAAAAAWPPGRAHMLHVIAKGPPPRGRFLECRSPTSVAEQHCCPASCPPVPPVTATQQGGGWPAQTSHPPQQIVTPWGSGNGSLLNAPVNGQLPLLLQQPVGSRVMAAAKEAAAGRQPAGVRCREHVVPLLVDVLALILQEEGPISNGLVATQAGKPRAVAQQGAADLPAASCKPSAWAGRQAAQQLGQR